VKKGKPGEEGAAEETKSKAPKSETKS
jgi:hypothetical protein